MSFKTLEERFTKASAAIYTRFGNPNIITETLPSSAKSRGNIQNDTQLLPTVSVIRDTELLSGLLQSDKGKLFIGKQTLLQTGNTFAETRLYNPASPILNVAPGLFFARHIGRGGVNLLQTPTRKYRGALQKSSIEAANPGLLGGLKTAITSPFTALFTKPELTEYFDSDADEFYLRPEDSFYSEDSTTGIPLYQPQSLSERGNLRTVKDFKTSLSGINVGFYGNDVNKKLTFKNPNNRSEGFKIGKEIVKDSPTIFNGNNGTGFSYMNFRSTDLNKTKSSVFNIAKKPGILFLNANLIPFPRSDSTFTKTIEYGLTNNIFRFTKTTIDGNPNSKSFKSLENSNLGNGYFYGNGIYNLTGISTTSETEKTSETWNASNVSMRTMLRDPFNAKLPQDISGIYDFIATEPAASTNNINPDIIKFIFQDDTTDKTIHFRAFINAFKETVKPEFSEQRYIGRTERFVTYGGAKRSATLNFNIVAFGQEEIHAAWARINYLTGLAFPKGITNGFMIPPLFRITIGNIYNIQPAYIDNLEFDFIDENTTFDIDNEVTQCIAVSMTITLLEKQTRFYNSPFYAIVEAQADAAQAAVKKAEEDRAAQNRQAQVDREAAATAAAAAAAAAASPSPAAGAAPAKKEQKRRRTGRGGNRPAAATSAPATSPMMMKKTPPGPPGSLPSSPFSSTVAGSSTAPWRTY